MSNREEKNAQLTENNSCRILSHDERLQKTEREREKEIEREREMEKALSGEERNKDRYTEARRKS